MGRTILSLGTSGVQYKIGINFVINISYIIMFSKYINIKLLKAVSSEP